MRVHVHLLCQLLLQQVWCWEPREAMAQLPAGVEHYIHGTCTSSPTFPKINGLGIYGKEIIYILWSSLFFKISNISRHCKQMFSVRFTVKLRLFSGKCKKTTNIFNLTQKCLNLEHPDFQFQKCISYTFVSLWVLVCISMINSLKHRLNQRITMFLYV